MAFTKIKSYAKINLALNVVGKTPSLHKIESIIAFISLHDEIFIKKIKSKKHKISFFGKFSKNIGKKNTINDLLELLEKKNLIKNRKFHIKINKKIPTKAGLGGGSMNAARVLSYFVEKKILKTSIKKLKLLANMIGSDVFLGLKFRNTILNSKKEVRHFNNYKKMHVLVVKPNFGCATKKIYSKVKKFSKTKFNKPTKKMFNFDYLKKMNNDLEHIAFSEYPKLRVIKMYLENLSNSVFTRMTGSGSAIVAYFNTKERCENAKKKFIRKYKNYWCIASKTI